MGFLLAAPVVLVGLTAAIEYGAWADRWITAIEVTRSAAREGATRPRSWNPGPTEMALVVLNGELAEHGLVGVASARLVGDAPDQQLEVRVELVHAPVFGLFPTPPTAHHAASFRMQDQP